MVKLRKERILVSLVVITLIALVFGSVSSLATAPVITPSTSGGNTENTAGAISPDTNTGNTNANNSGSISATVGASSNNTANNTNAVNNEASNTNRNANTPSSKLPYAGSNSSVVFIVIALVASALYAYKKVSDYNV